MSEVAFELDFSILKLLIFMTENNLLGLGWGCCLYSRIVASPPIFIRYYKTILFFFLNRIYLFSLERHIYREKETQRTCIH